MRAIANIVEPVRAASRTMATLGVILMALGVLSILAPLAAGLAVTTIIGLLMIAAGLTWVTFSFHAHSWGSGSWEALVGVLATIMGVVVLSHPLVDLAVLTLILAAYFFTTGILRSVFAFQFRKHKSWIWILLNGIVSIALGVMIAFEPISDLWALGTVLGIDLLLGGFGLFRLGNATTP